MDDEYVTVLLLRPRKCKTVSDRETQCLISPHMPRAAGGSSGIGAVIATPAIIAATGSQAAASSQAEASERPRTTTPECLSDLVAMGVVTDADFVAR